jgi:hypothetical protein
MFVFLLGVAVGVAAILGWQNRDKIIEAIKNKLAG